MKLQTLLLILVFPILTLGVLVMGVVYPRPPVVDYHREAVDPCLYASIKVSDLSIAEQYAPGFPFGDTAQERHQKTDDAYEELLQACQIESAWFYEQHPERK